MTETKRSFAKVMAMTVIGPYTIGLFLSSFLVPSDYFVKESAEIKIQSLPKEEEEEERYLQGSGPCDEVIDKLIIKNDNDDPFKGVTVHLHRNGEPTACGSTDDTMMRQSMKWAAAYNDNYCPDEYDKYDFESFLTETLYQALAEDDVCGSSMPQPTAAGFLGYCDMGQSKTPILHDHDKLLPIPLDGGGEVLPCHFHTREGVRVSSMEQLMDISRKAQSSGTCDESDQSCSSSSNVTPELHLYAVPAGRVFMFAPSHVGEIFELPHVSVKSGLPVYLEVMSLSPRVFDIFNFYDREESDDLIRKALAETTETHKLKRSTTGATTTTVFTKRTSESGFDTHGSTSQTVKRRCMNVLGWDEYIEGHTDGLQILRYNQTKAYIPHMDYLDSDGSSKGYDYDSAHVGGNRYATILLYMSDLGEHDGGETVFAEAWPKDQPEEEHVELKQALKELRESGDANELEHGSWEEKMVAQCRSKLAIRPNSARAVLFYSQNPDGTEDKSSLHGGCPVLRGTKWAANLWVWNAPREGFEGAPFKDGTRTSAAEPTPVPNQLQAKFINSGTDPAFETADLYYEETRWGPIGHGDPPLHVNTFQGHRWNVRVNNQVVKRWEIGPEANQEFKL